MELLWPLHKWHYLTVPPDEEWRPYLTCNAILLDSPDAEDDSPIDAGTVRGVITDAQLASIRVTHKWKTCRQIATEMGVNGNGSEFACLAAALTAAVDNGFCRREQRRIDVNGRPLLRWVYAKPYDEASGSTNHNDLYDQSNH